MVVTLSADEPQDVLADWLLILVCSDEDPAKRLLEIDQRLGGAIAGVLAREDFSASDQELLVLYQTAGVRATNILLCGCGESTELRRAGVRKSLLAGFRRICSKAAQTVAIACDPLLSSMIQDEELAELVAECTEAAPIDASVCRREQKHHALGDVVLCNVATNPETSQAIRRGQLVATAVNLVKDLVNRPANEVYPETFCDRIAGLAVLRVCDVKFDEAMLRRERMVPCWRWLRKRATGSHAGPAYPQRRTERTDLFNRRQRRHL